MAAPNPAPEPTPPLPYGEDRPGRYRLAFNVWLVLFLMVICVGLLNFLGTKLKPFVGGF